MPGPFADSYSPIPGSNPLDRSEGNATAPGRYRLRETVRCEGRLLVATRPLVVTRINDAATCVVDSLSTESYRRPETVAEAASVDRAAVETLLERLHERDLLAWRPERDRTYQPPVSVVVTVRNAADQLEECLDALEELGYPEYEVVIVDDGSTDGTRPLVEGHSCPARLVEVGRSDAPIGIGASRNRGVTAADNEVVAFTDADCRPRPDWLSQLVPALADHAVVGGRVRPADDDGVSAYEAVNSSLDMGPRAARVRRDGANPYLPTANVLARTSTYESVGFPERNVAEDVNFCWNALEHGLDVVYDPRGVVDHDYGDGRRFGQRRRSYGASEALLATMFPTAGAVPLPVTPIVIVVLFAFIAAVALPFGLGGIAVGLAAGIATLVGRDVWGTRRRSAGLVGVAETLRSLRRRTLSSTYAITREVTRYYSLPVVAVAGPVATVSPLAGGVLVSLCVFAAVVPAVVEYLIHRPAIGGLGYGWYYLRDHLAYQLGVYRGAVAHRTVRHLRPTGRFQLRFGR
jgi:mycofactocin system glycosyltransferase